MSGSLSGDDPVSSEATLEADARLDRYLDSYLEAAMDLPRLGEHLAADDREPPPAPPLSPPLPPHTRHAPAEPLPAWLRGDEKLFGADDLGDDFQDDFRDELDDLESDDPAKRPLGLRGLRWIRKNMSSFKVTVSLQRPVPAPGRPRKLP